MLSFRKFILENWFEENDNTHLRRRSTIQDQLGKSKIELLSVGNPDTIKFYKRFLFKRVNPENEFAKKGTRKGLIAYRRRVTRKKAVSDKPAGGAGRALSDSN